MRENKCLIANVTLFMSCRCLSCLQVIGQGNPCQVGSCGVCNTLWCCNCGLDSFVLPSAKNLQRSRRRQLPVSAHLIRICSGCKASWFNNRCCTDFYHFTNTYLLYPTSRRRGGRGVLIPRSATENWYLP